MSTKPIITMVFLFFLNLGAEAQDFSITDRNQEVLYDGMSNPIDVEVENLDCEDYWLEVDNGRVRRDTCDFKVEPTETGRAIISLKRVIDSDTVLIGTARFRVEPFPEIIAEVGRKTGGNIDKTTLSVQPGILAYLSADWQIDVRFEVVHYTIMLVRGNSVLLHTSANSNRFTEEVKSQLRNAQAGDHVFFYNLKAKIPTEEAIRNMEPLILTVTEKD